MPKVHLPVHRQGESTVGRQPANWPASLSYAAFDGLAGVFVNVVEPESEADPAAMLVQFLVGFGNLIGRGPHFVAGADCHYTNLQAVVVGDTAKARKGMSWGHALQILRLVDTDWGRDRVKSGLASGEGLIRALSDGNKQLLLYEPEFSRVLKIAERKGSVVSEILRQAWDGGDLAILTRSNPLQVSGAHVSLVGQITVEELRLRLSELEALNGFANRFLFVCAARSKCLPNGGAVDIELLAGIAECIQEAVEFARAVGEMRRDAVAAVLWESEYPALSSGRPGKFGAATARGEAQVMRLACIYALLDSKSEVSITHLNAALEVWRYCEQSARFIFGDATGDDIADAILDGLCAGRREGLTRTEISRLFYGNETSDRIDAALALLERSNLARVDRERASPAQRKPTERWFVV
jgi:hypothetical protein